MKSELLTALLLACKKGLGDVVDYIQKHHGDKITPEMQEQIALAQQAAKENEDQEEPAKETNLMSSALGLMTTGMEAMSSLAESRAEALEELDKLGPQPRTGMEIFLGKLA